MASYVFQLFCLIILRFLSVISAGTVENVNLCDSPGTWNDLIFRSVTPKGRFEAGIFTKYEDASDLVDCITRCCEVNSCNVVFYYDSTCYHIQCNKTSNACEPEKRDDKKYRSTYMVIVRKWDLNEEMEDDDQDDQEDEPQRSCEYGLDDDLCGRHEECVPINRRSRGGICTCKRHYVRSRLTGECEYDYNPRAKIKPTTLPSIRGSTFEESFSPSISLLSSSTKTSVANSARTEFKSSIVSSPSSLSASSSSSFSSSSSYSPSTLLKSSPLPITTSTQVFLSKSSPPISHEEIDMPDDRTVPLIANAGHEQHWLSPVQYILLDGSNSSGIDLKFLWVQTSGPTFATIHNSDKAITKVTNLGIGDYTFKLQVTNDYRESSSSVKISIKESINHPPIANAGGDVIVTLPVTVCTLDASKSYDDKAIVSYIWTKDDSSPAAGSIVNGSDHNAKLLLTDLIVGNYTFHLKVFDAEGLSSVDIVHLFVQPSPYQNDIVELIMVANIETFTERNKKHLEDSLSIILIPSSRVHIFKVMTADNGNLRLHLIAYSLLDKPPSIIPGHNLESLLRSKLLSGTNILEYPVTSINTLECQNNCSHHGYCSRYTHQCICDWFWMESTVRVYYGDGERNCDWGPLHITAVILILVAVCTFISLLITCLCRRSARKHTVKGKLEYNLLSSHSGNDWKSDKGVKYRSNASFRTDSDLSSEEETLFVNTGMNSAKKNGVAINKSGLKT